MKRGADAAGRATKGHNHYKNIKNGVSLPGGTKRTCHTAKLNTRDLKLFKQGVLFTTKNSFKKLALRTNTKFSFIYIGGYIIIKNN